MWVKEQKKKSRTALVICPGRGEQPRCPHCSWATDKDTSAALALQVVCSWLPREGPWPTEPSPGHEFQFLTRSPLIPWPASLRTAGLAPVGCGEPGKVLSGEVAWVSGPRG